MTLTLSRVNEMEEGAEAEDDSGKKELENKATCYYLPTSNVYHSSNSCSACAGKNTKKSTVQEIKKIRIESGKNKGKRKYRPCSKCWIT